MKLLAITFVLLLCGVVGQMVQPEDCEEENHEYHNYCGTACPPTCQDRRDPKPCRRSCNVACYCTEGYIRDLVSTKCLRVEQCPINSG